MVFSPFVYGIFSMFSFANEWIYDFQQRWNKKQLKWVLPVLILQASQSMSLKKARRTYVFANNIDKIITLKYSPEFNSRVHQTAIHRVEKPYVSILLSSWYYDCLHIMKPK